VAVFDNTFWSEVRTKITRKAQEMREQGFSGSAMVNYSELEYGGITERMEKLDDEFRIEE